MQHLQKELEQASRRNRELAEANKDTSREYSKLRAQYANSLGKNVASNAGFTVKGSNYEHFEQAAGPAGNHLISVNMCSDAWVGARSAET